VRAAPDAPLVLAMLALVFGAIAMGISPVFVRFADVGPLTSAFWRVFLALPVLWLWARMEPRPPTTGLWSGWGGGILIAGLAFAGDLIFWHLSIMKTAVANATFLATLAPIWVALGSGLFIGERITRSTLFGLAVCLVGATVLVGTSYSMVPGRLEGDLFGLVTSLFFGIYFLAVRVARRSAPSGVVMFRSTVYTALALGVVALALEDRFLPQTLAGIAAILALAIVTHVGGQGLLAFALGHLSAAFSSLVIFLEAVAAAAFGWIFLQEPLTLPQIAGGLAILAGIWVARPRGGG